MTYTHSNNSEFSNDRLTDAILHRDDEHMISDERDAEQPSVKMEESNSGTLAQHNACWFPIHFLYDGVDYTADVKKILTPLAEYHVHDVMPVVEHLPEPYVVAEHFSREKYDYPVNEAYYPAVLGATVLKAIQDGSNNTSNLDSWETDL